MKCNNCNRENAVGTKFCIYCGKTLVSTCEHCRRDISYGVKFCPYCGHKMNVQGQKKFKHPKPHNKPQMPHQVPSKEENPNDGWEIFWNILIYGGAVILGILGVTVSTPVLAALGIPIGAVALGLKYLADNNK